jgi:hypothetical protein
MYITVTMENIIFTILNKDLKKVTKMFNHNRFFLSQPLSVKENNKITENNANILLHIVQSGRRKMVRKG